MSAIISLFILLMLSTLTSAENKDNTIDWTKCKTEYVCFIHAKCKGNGGSDLLIFEKISEIQDRDGKDWCHEDYIGMGIKPLNQHKWLVKMIVQSDGLGVNDGLVFGAGSNEMFGCKKDGLVQYSKLKNTWDGEPTFNENLLFCSFVISSGETITLKTMFDELDSGSDEIEFKFKYTKSGGEIVSPVDAGSFTKLTNGVELKRRCNPFEAKFDETYNTENYLTKPILITKESQNACPSGAGNLYIQEASSKKYVQIDDIECKKGDSRNTYQYQYTKKGETIPVLIPVSETFNVYCGIKVDTKCIELSKSQNCTACTKPSFTAGDWKTETAVKFKCPDNRWEFDIKDEEGTKKFEYLEGTAKCKKGKTGTDVTWFLEGTTKENGIFEHEMTAASCTKRMNCFQHSNIRRDCPRTDNDKVAGCLTPNSTDPNTECPGNVMFKNGKDKASEVGEMWCNEETGEWVHAKSRQDEFKVIPEGANVFCFDKAMAAKEQVSTGGSSELMTMMIFILAGGLVIIIMIIAILCIRKHRKYSKSERELRKRPNTSFWLPCKNEKLPCNDLASLKEWDDTIFDRVMASWLKFSIYERYKFAERVGFELGVASTCENFFTLLMRCFEVETDYRVWQNLVPVIKLVHAQAAEKEDNKECDKRMRKFISAQCKKLLEMTGLEGVNFEWRDKAYLRYVAFNLLYYCDDKQTAEMMTEMFEKSKYNLHSINRQVIWAYAVRDKNQFDLTRQAAVEAFCDKNVVREINSRKEAKAKGSKTSSEPSNSAKDIKGKSTKAKKPASNSKESKSKESKSKESKSKASEGSNNSSNKDSKKEKKGGSKEAKKGGSKEKVKGSREKAGGESSKEKKDKSDKSGKKTSSKEKKGGSKEGGKSTKDKRDSNESKSGKEIPEGKSSKEKKDSSGSKKGSKSSKEKQPLVDKSNKSRKSTKSTKSMKNGKSSKTKKIGLKERKDADGDKLHGDRSQHLFFALGSSRNKEEVASFLDWYIESKQFDPSNLVYLFQAALEWDDTRSNGLDLFLNMSKRAFKSMPPGQKYHMRILKNFRRYVIGQVDLQKIQDHIVNDPNYTAAHYKQIELSLMLKRIHNNVILQPNLISELDEALKKYNF